jgi:type 1 fimbriae regulatory protein FimB/type 1 fimbriae regulatory protein FimE
MDQRSNYSDSPHGARNVMVDPRGGTREKTEKEVERLMDAARKHGRYGHRDSTMILLAYRHGLRASELVDLQWSQIELDAGRLHVRRAKKGTPSVHPLQGDEIRALRRLRREQEASPFVFVSERNGPMTAKSWGNHFERLGRHAGMAFPIVPHMLRHACGFALANAGHDTRSLQAYLGPRTSSTRRATPNWNRIASRTSGSPTCKTDPGPRQRLGGPFCIDRPPTGI